MTQYYYGTKLIEAWASEKDGKEGYQVKYKDGYLSWSPKDVFEEAYQPLDALSFGHALEVLKSGGKVARSGWNGKNMYLFFKQGNLPYLPYLVMCTVQQEFVPWLASQTDVLANDWQVVK